MAKFIRKKTKSSGGARSTRSSSTIKDMTKREYNLRKADINSRNKKMKYDYKTASKNTRAAVQKSSVRSAAGSSMVASGSNSATEQARAESDANKVVYVYRNDNARNENDQQNGGIGGGGSSYGYKGQDDDF